MATNENLPPNVIKQLARELKSLDESPPEGIKVGVKDDDLSVIYAEIEGPGFFLTKIFHPNISSDGKICVNTLKKDWNPSLGLRHVLVVVRCLLIEPFPESALNEQASKMLLDNYDDYFKHARLLTEIHAKPKPKSKSGAISESTTALNVDQTNTSAPNVVDHKNTALASTTLSLASELPPCSTTSSGGGSNVDQVVSTGRQAMQPVTTSSAKHAIGVMKAAAEKKKMDARKKSLKRL